MPLDTLHCLQAGQLAGSRQLKISCGLREFPPEIFSLADTLEVLDLSGNELSELPDDLRRLHRLRVLFCSENRFTRLPASIGGCAQLSMVGFKANQIVDVPAAALPPLLRWFILTDNRVEHLPTELGQRPALQKLMLAGNRLRELPDSLAQCSQLELLRISANRLNALPDWLLRLPRLSWLAFAGNPMLAEAESRAIEHAQAPAIDRAALAVGQVLGEGASGVISEATWHSAEGPLPVALKRFKGQMTSDGLPRSELAACLAAGSHPNLIGIHGLLNSPAGGAPDLVMRRIDASFKTLAGPPSMASCTRDVYDKDQSFTLANALHIALGIASAGAHLHSRGILHGDLYAHNTLWHAQVPCLLGDLGAASLLPTDQPEVSQALMRIEVRALGCMLEELGSRLIPAPALEHEAHRSILEKFQALQAACLHPRVGSRPSMTEAADRLLALQQQTVELMDGSA